MFGIRYWHYGWQGSYLIIEFQIRSLTIRFVKIFNLIIFEYHELNFNEKSLQYSYLNQNTWFVFNKLFTGWIIPRWYRLVSRVQPVFVFSLSDPIPKISSNLMRLELKYWIIFLKIIFACPLKVTWVNMIRDSYIDIWSLFVNFTLLFKAVFWFCQSDHQKK